MDEPQITSDCPQCRLLQGRVSALQNHVAAEQTQIAKLTAELEEVCRAGKRQAAPFRKPKGLALRDRQEAGEVSQHGLLVMAGRLESQMLDLVFPVKKHTVNAKLANFLYGHLDELFAYLRHPGMDATNYRAEQAIRPAVVNRNVWGGNRTWMGARVQSILASVIRTCRQRLVEPFHFLTKVLTRPQPPPLPLPS